jgi:hypothetical protein
MRTDGAAVTKLKCAVALALVVAAGPPAFAQPAPPDVFILLDTTGDMSGSINSLKASLTTTIVPGLTANNPGIGFGLSFFRDFPVSPYGDPTDYPYRLTRPVSTSTTAIQTGINSAVPGGGGDGEESGHEALYQLASGGGVSWPGGSLPPARLIFRRGSRRVALVVTTAVFHQNYVGIASHSANEAVSALANAGVKVVSLSVFDTGQGNVARPGLEAYARATGARVPASALSASGLCPTGLNGALRPADPDGTCPLVFDVAATGAGADTAVVTAVDALLDQVFFDGFNASPGR